ncbi:MAG TPA: hypothetical protein VLX59_16680, partial [Acidimicrobiales bacterium]|nr:hypothetical protein [Acidimicrobiales bacterium]
MDVRFSAEQQALRDAAAHLSTRWGPRNVRDLDDGERAAKLEAAVGSSGWRELRAAGEGTAPLASGVEAAIVAEELGRALADTAFIGPTLAADLRRRAGAEPAGRLETVLVSRDLRQLATDDTAEWLAIDARDCRQALMMTGGDLVGRLTLADDPLVAGSDLTRSLVHPPGERLEPLRDSRPLGRDEIQAWTAFGLALACADLVGVMRGVI